MRPVPWYEMTDAELRRLVRAEVERQLREQRGARHEVDSGLGRGPVDHGAVRERTGEAAVVDAAPSHALICATCGLECATPVDLLAHDLDAGHLAERVSRLRPKPTRGGWRA